MDPTPFQEMLAAIRTAKAAHAVAYRALVEAQANADAAWDRLAKAQRAVGEYVDRLTDEPARFKPRVIRGSTAAEAMAREIPGVKSGAAQ